MKAREGISRVWNSGLTHAAAQIFSLKKLHFKIMDRNPDINLEKETIPADCYLHEGKLLQGTVRAAKIPFGLGYTQTTGRNNKRTTCGLIIRHIDRERLLKAIASRKFQPSIKAKPVNSIL